jgi:HemY protein
MRHWYGDRHVRKARQDLLAGMGALIEERWADAEKQLTHHVAKSELPVCHYLGAAKAANAQGAFDRRDTYLDQARSADDNFFSFPVDILQARLQFDAGQMELALSTLKQLQEIVPNHPSVLRLMVTLYENAADWSSLQQLLPQLRSVRVLASDQLSQLMVATYQGLLTLAAQGDGATSLDATWEAVPRDIKKDPGLLIVYIKGLIEQKAFAKAEQLLVKTLKKQWMPELLSLYTTLAVDHVDKSIKTAKAWLKTYPDDGDLLRCLGILSTKASQVESARAYFEASLRQFPHPTTYHLLGELLEKSGDQRAALAVYRKAMNLDVGVS